MLCVLTNVFGPICDTKYHNEENHKRLVKKVHVNILNLYVKVTFLLKQVQKDNYTIVLEKKRINR